MKPESAGFRIRISFQRNTSGHIVFLYYRSMLWALILGWLDLGMYGVRFLGEDSRLVFW